MKIFKITNLEYIPAGHEDPQNPGVMKKVIFTVNDIKLQGTIQMMNWAEIKPNKSFARHYHEYMDEIFVIISGHAEITINNETSVLEATDTVYIPPGAEHEMKNISQEKLVYIAIGIVTKPDGKTIVVN